MDFRGIVTRVVEADPSRGFGPRYFVRPVDPAVYRQIDGSRFCASGEIPVPASDPAAHQVGDEADFSI